MKNFKQNWLKFSLSLILCLLVRLIPVRPPNIEPIFATQMPLAGAYGPYTGFLFGFLSIVFYDLITNTLGVWTFFTSITYGTLGLLAYLYFKKRKPNILNFTTFAVIGTLFFDGVTGLSIGPIFFHQSLWAAFVGQIPFTLWHLLGNVSFALVLSPAIYNFVIKNEKIEKFYGKQEKIQVVA